ncbi:MAG: NAD-dependent epimerase/dehydratase family protein, partial [Nitrospinaceae bacterium]
ARRVEEFHEVNTNTLAHLLDLLAYRDGSAGDCHVVFVSSLTARHPHISPYARSKFNAEEILKARGNKSSWTIVRPPAVYGPGDMEILKLFRVMKRGYVPVVGGVDKSFSLIHGRDLAAAILSILDHETAIHKTLEPDDKKKSGYTVHDVAEVATAELGRQVRPLVLPEALLHTLAFANEALAFATGKAPFFSRHKVREVAHPNWVSDPKTHKAISNWRPEIGIKEGVKETIHWYRDRKLL